MDELRNKLISRNDSFLLVVDVQARLAPAIFGIDHILKRNEALLSACEKLDIPVVFTEQYPKGIGHTIPRLRDLAVCAQVYEKIHFDATAEPEFLALITAIGRREVVVIGTEAHVCVLQTALGLRSHNYAVKLCVDATGSRKEIDKEIALQRMASEGLSLVTTEMVLFEWLRRAGTDEFSDLLPLVRELVEI
ncbi:MAG: hydrolase [Albidovulum sp.]|nr:hydrolase [Albidovulum sp.]MDE0303851.1 hydrolase [Albidovulum sp.]MDE0532713.1 hydrolase [Albidovulum sp.]